MRGDFEALKRLAQSAGKLATPQWRHSLNKQLAEEARTQVVRGFEQERDPYGTPWKPALRGGKTLRDTGRLLNSLRPRASADSFSISTNIVYAAIHQYGGTIKAKSGGGLRFQLPIGTRFVGKSGKRLARPQALKSWVTVQQVKIPRRQFIPDGDRGLGPIWFPVMQRVVSAHVRSSLGTY